MLEKDWIPHKLKQAQNEYDYTSEYILDCEQKIKEVNSAEFIKELKEKIKNANRKKGQIQKLILQLLDVQKKYKDQEEKRAERLKGVK